jgi:hypothetical protein
MKPTPPLPDKQTLSLSPLTSCQYLTRVRSQIFGLCHCPEPRDRSSSAGNPSTLTFHSSLIFIYKFYIAFEHPIFNS